jgi:hypothetical protein
MCWGGWGLNLPLNIVLNSHTTSNLDIKKEKINKKIPWASRRSHPHCWVFFRFFLYSFSSSSSSSFVCLTASFSSISISFSFFRFFTFVHFFSTSCLLLLFHFVFIFYLFVLYGLWSLHVYKYFFNF